MKYVVFIWAFFALALVPLRAQNGYHLKAGKDYETIRFKFINNLIILPIEVNGVELSFILDTGVSKPILFNLTGEDAPELYNYEEIELKGLGDGQPVKAIRSRGNTFRMDDLFNTNQELYMITDSNINFSPRLGFPVHGIIGYDLLKNFIVEVKYNRKKIRFHDPESYTYKRCGKCETYRLDIVGNKPFMNARVAFGENETRPVYLLVDSGSTDAVWLFEDEDQGIEVPEKHFDDYMGRGLSGDVYGKRSKLKSFNIGNFELEDAKVAFPDSSSVRNITFKGARNGSLGSEILKRFNLIIDYPYERITLAKNGNFRAPFHYNMSGIELEHNGFRVVAESSAADLGSIF
ncbi:retropepsin-like aspartic protease [Robertkochia flava]|uniref:retropepsin-like aspartic protease n=1 Tax=Robertkochia flava TaxID=3447986 RepID=UPI001CD00945|nr:retropepsin-like aspartic protease [Robertkochia marina]